MAPLTPAHSAPQRVAAAPPAAACGDNYDNDDTSDLVSNFSDEDFWSVGSTGEEEFEDCHSEEYFHDLTKPPSHTMDGGLTQLEAVLPGIPAATRGCVPALRRHALERPDAPALTWWGRCKTSNSDNEIKFNSVDAWLASAWFPTLAPEM